LALCAAVELGSFAPTGHFPTAGLAPSGLQNLEATDAVYVAPLDMGTGGSILRIAVEFGLSPSNAACVAFGPPHDPRFLRIVNEDGRFSLLMGGEVRPFDTPLPPPLTVTRTYKLTLAMDMTANRFAATVKVYEDGALIPNSQSLIPNFPPPPSAWTEHPATWTHATLHLRGQATLKSLRCTLDFPASIIILR